MFKTKKYISDNRNILAIIQESKIYLRKLKYSRQ